MACIYCATNTVNGKRYVGFSKNLHRRKITHKSSARSGSLYPFHKAIRKYGFEAFVFEVLVENSDANYLLRDVEPKIIAALTPEYNVTAGGEGVLLEKFTDVHREKLSKNHANFTGSNNPFFGKTHSLEVRQRIAESKRGRQGPNKGKVFSEESRRKMSEAAKSRKRRA